MSTAPAAPAGDAALVAAFLASVAPPVLVLRCGAGRPARPCRSVVGEVRATPAGLLLKVHRHWADEVQALEFPPRFTAEYVERAAAQPVTQFRLDTGAVKRQAVPDERGTVVALDQAVPVRAACLRHRGAEVVDTVAVEDQAMRAVQRGRQADAYLRL